MGQDLRYIAGDREIERRITLADWKLIEELRKHLPEETATVFLVPELSEDVVESVETLTEASAKLAEFFDNHADVLPYSYKYRCERIPGHPDVVTGYSSGGLSGIRLPDDSEHFYFLRAGLDECSLERWGVSDGKGFPIDRQDLRQHKELLTDNMGRITIRRTRAKTNLRESLEVIRQFLNTVTDPTVVKRID